MGEIKSVVALPHLDSQGGWGLEVTVLLSTGVSGSAAVPSGAAALTLKRRQSASTERRAIEEYGFLDSVNPYARLAQRWAENLQHDVIPKLVGLDASNQAEVDDILGDYNCSDYWLLYGINVMSAVSIATARAAAEERRIDLFERIAQLAGGWPIGSIPVPMVTVIEGGYRVANDLDLQALMVVPIGALSADEAHQWTDRVVFKLKEIMAKHNPPLDTSVGEQGGFVPKFGALSSRSGDGWRHIALKALDLIAEAVSKCGLRLGDDICLAIDCAMTGPGYDISSSTYTLQKYAAEVQGGQNIGGGVHTKDLLDFYEQVHVSHAVWIIEDGLHPTDQKGWMQMTKRLGTKMWLVGDDLFDDKSGRLTSRTLLRRYSDAGIANAMLVMPHRMGTLTETMKVVDLAKSVEVVPLFAVRAREVEDDSIADIAVACGAPHIRCGGFVCSERNSKFDRLRKIEQLVGPTATYASGPLLKHVRKGMKTS